jgi:hypothetical protein
MSEEGPQALLALDQRHRHQVLPIEEEQIEREVDEILSGLGIRRGLQLGKGRRAVRVDRAELAIEIGLAQAKPGERLRSCLVAVRPIEPGAGYALNDDRARRSHRR